MRSLSLAALLVSAGATAPSCKSDTGSDVDFAYSFKYPSSWDHAYMDSKHKLAKSKSQLNSKDSAVTATIQQMNTKGNSHVLWNDQPPPKKDSAAPHAHSKGAIIFNEEGGLWLTHSLPHFPTPSTTAAGLWADGSNYFGQAFLCITLTAKELHKLSPVMMITSPVVYSTDLLGTRSKDAFSDIKEWAVDGKKDVETMTTEVEITSAAGTTFHFFGKSGEWGKPKYGKDLYSDLVAPKMGDLDMEGWRRGAGVWGPACGKVQVLDITDVSFPGNEWKTMDDHSKWAVTEKSTAFCVGDINRADGQDRRGGGTVCIESSSIAKQMKAVVKTTDACSKLAMGNDCKPMTSSDPCFEKCHLGVPQNCTSEICLAAGKIGCMGVQCKLMGTSGTSSAHCMSPMSELTVV